MGWKSVLFLHREVFHLEIPSLGLTQVCREAAQTLSCQENEVTTQRPAHRPRAVATCPPPTQLYGTLPTLPDLLSAGGHGLHLQEGCRKGCKARDHSPSPAFRGSAQVHSLSQPATTLHVESRCQPEVRAGLLTDGQRMASSQELAWDVAWVNLQARATPGRCSQWRSWCG